MKSKVENNKHGGSPQRTQRTFTKKKGTSSKSSKLFVLLKGIVVACLTNYFSYSITVTVAKLVYSNLRRHQIKAVLMAILDV